MTHFKPFLFALFILLNTNILFAQTKKQLSNFYQNFDSIKFELLHLYTDGLQATASYSSNSSYPFKGKKINPPPLLKKVLKVDHTNDYFAIFRYSIAPQIEGLILRVYDQEMQSNTIYNLIYNTSTQTIRESILLAHDYQAEGGSGATQSWILDLDNNHQLDILTRSYYDKYEYKNASEEVHLIHRENSYLNIVKQSHFQRTPVQNEDLQQLIANDFPYRPIYAPFMSEDTHKKLLNNIKKSGLVIPSETD
ncbi:hypothetical protein [Aureispira sp. CCB-QB1]|uniref:hypothetical protein n=1 Tax=Aureispira sp. CCB-QB1 TaxID=1313421 RepID=UPI0006960AB0|nr:hypothetical protein [Aureispira sp. CCB-QB1]